MNYSQIGGAMVKEHKQKRDEKKKPTFSLKERRARKQEKRRGKTEHHVDLPFPEE